MNPMKVINDLVLWLDYFRELFGISYVAKRNRIDHTNPQHDDCIRQGFG